jgi:hypothetical protein
MRPAELLAVSDERDLQLRLRLADRAEGYALGYAVGYDAGRLDEARDLEAAYHEMASRVARGGPSYAELERRRWTVHGEPRTRETFAQPHPADRPRDGRPRRDR